MICTANYFIFRNPREMFFLMANDFAFLFVNVLLVIVLIERLTASREKRVILRKLNMVIGTFYSEVGLELLRCFAGYIENGEVLRNELQIQPAWTHQDFRRALTAARSAPYDLNIEPSSLAELRAFFLKKRDFLVMLLENPNLLEHDRFTDLLWAVFHLAEELEFRRGSLDALPEADYRHLMGDARRACSQLTAEWVAYAEHPQGSYPFLFSLAARINPFSPDPSAVIR
ncbi:MAG TPA: hypothetical protein VMS75_09430 [Terriglobales bacterium]|nr:hypothetical protein [Terriglobales bacterium]